MNKINELEFNGTVYQLGESGGGSADIATIKELIKQNEYRWDHRHGIVYPCSYFNSTTKLLAEGGAGLYTCLRYGFDGTERRVRFSANTGGSSKYLAYTFLDENNNVLAQPTFKSGEAFKDYEMDVPEGSKTLWLNGNNYVSVHLEVSQNDLQSDPKTLDKLLREMSRKISYREKFAWKPMPTGLIAFTFDDSLDDIGLVTDLFIQKGVPCCYGAIPEYINKGITSGAGEETVAMAMMRGVQTVGCEVLAHGSSANEIVIDSNINDMNFLYNKFAINKRKFMDLGFDVRGTVRVGGSGNITHDPRTDVWCRLFFDYGDAYGLEEPYSHTRFSGSTTQSYYDAIDKAIRNKEFCPLLFHGADLDELPRMIDYVIEHGGQIVNYAHVYDTYGSTEEQVSILNRLDALERADGNEVAY